MHDGSHLTGGSLFGTLEPAMTSQSEPQRALCEELERLYRPRLTKTQRTGYAIAAASAAALGAALMAQDGRTWSLFGLGAFGFAAGTWLWRQDAAVICVGPAGVAWQERGESRRLRWCDIRKIQVTVSYLELQSAAGPYYVSLQAQPLAAARIIWEGGQRIMTRLALSRASHERLPSLEGDDAPLQRIGALQFAGSPCANSEDQIQVEQDARLCPRCTAAYHRDNVPAVCVVCQASVGDRAWTA